MNDAYVVFCKAFGFELYTWNTLFEFSAAIGFAAILWPKDMDGDMFKVTPRTATWVERLNSPHQLTMANVLKSKRYSFYGRVSTPIIKAWHALRYANFFVVSFVNGLVRVFGNEHY
jgi:hypothetical protein